MAKHRRTRVSNILLILVLYVLQGINLGIANSIPIFLIAAGATWKDRGTFNFSLYPFSLKLLWAPLTDVIYSVRFGKRKSWLVPIQVCLAGLFLLLSFYIGPFITNNRVVLLTIIFFAIVLLTATQDICVDGLAVTLFTLTNPQWASTSQTVGQTFGRFLGFSFLLTFESANFTNQFIRGPLSLSPQPTGLLSVKVFVRFVAVAFLIVTTCLAIFFRENKQQSSPSSENGEEEEEENRLSLKETYLSIIKLFKKKCMRQLTLVSVLSPIGLVATNYMTQMAVVNQGVPRETLALVNIPVTLISMIAPFLIRDTQRPLLWFARAYVLCLISTIPIAAYVYFTPRLIVSTYYYPLLILFLGFHEFVMALRSAAHVGFFAAISEPRIGSTYMTLLVTISNLGYALNSSTVLYIANWLPKRYAYVIAVGVCVIIGTIWIVFSYRILRYLQELPAERWYVLPEKPVDGLTTLNEQESNDHKLSLIPDKSTTNNHHSSRDRLPDDPPAST